MLMDKLSDYESEYEGSTPSEDTNLGLTRTFINLVWYWKGSDTMATKKKSGTKKGGCGK